MTHLPGIWFGVGEHSLLLTPDRAASSPLRGDRGGSGYGVEGSLGADYTLQANHFLFSVGAGFQVWHSIVPVMDMQAELPNAVDKNGYPFTFMYDISGRRDAYSALGVEVPLMLGGSFGRFYFLLGGKFFYNYSLPTVTRMQVNTSGVYKQFLDPFTGMPNHQYFSEASLRSTSPCPSTGKGDWGKGLDLAASAELGLRLTKDLMSGHPALYLSVYADVGMLNYNRQSGLPCLVLPTTFVDREDEPNMVERLGTAPVLGSVALHGAFVRHLAVGVKLAVRFPHVQKKRYPCHCLQETRKVHRHSDDF